MDPKPVAASDSIAAKLQRIRAFVSRNESRAETVDFVEDQHAEVFATPPSAMLAEAIADTDEAQSAAPTEDPLGTERDKTIDRGLDGVQISPILEDRAVEETDHNEAAEDPASPPNQDDIATPDAVDTLVLALTAKDQVVPRALSTTEPIDEAVDSAENATGDDQNTDPEMSALNQDPSDAREPATLDAADPHVRVVKVKRAYLEAAIAAGDLEEIDEDGAELSSLSPKTRPIFCVN